MYSKSSTPAIRESSEALMSLPYIVLLPSTQAFTAVCRLAFEDGEKPFTSVIKEKRTR